jgi:squalene-hopene/tetraprenyl-beta-curcumene cyclase
MKLSTRVAAPVFMLCAVAVLRAADGPVPSEPAFQSSGASNRPTTWDRNAAAKYLDDRMDLWFAKARKLKTGEGKTTCVSCHITAPYVLARPALRRALGVTKPTAQEVKLLNETLRRVESYGVHEPMSKGKEEQSRGSEAVLNLLILASEDAREERPRPGGPTRQALDELWAAQRADGAWDWLDTGMEPYESNDSVYYGAALAAIAVGTASGYADGAGEDVWGNIGKMRSYLRANYTNQSLYNKTWALLASTRLQNLLSPDQVVALAADLQMKQNADGGWSLYLLGPWTWSKTSPPYKPRGEPDVEVLARSDAYATGLISYVLRQAQPRGFQSSLNRAITWLEAHQQEIQIDQTHWKCWRSFSLNFDTEHGGEDGEPWRRMFMSDAATAFAVLALLPAD